MAARAACTLPDPAPNGMRPVASANATTPSAQTSRALACASVTGAAGVAGEAAPPAGWATQASGGSTSGMRLARPDALTAPPSVSTACDTSARQMRLRGVTLPCATPAACSPATARTAAAMCTATRASISAGGEIPRCESWKRDACEPGMNSRTT